MKFSEREIQVLLYHRNHQRFQVLMPNYTPSGWWECDLFGVTESGYFHEFEIKLTLADFRRDAKKRRQDSSQWIGNERQSIPGKLKHSLIGGAPGPSRFWYVMPQTIAVDLAEIPEWAGLQVIHDRNYAKIVRQAPTLHKEKISDHIVRHALSVCYYRYWNERRAFDGMQRSYLSLLNQATPLPAEIV